MAKVQTVEQTVKRGILLIAIGNKEYLDMAKNLAMSIKNVEPEMPIALVHNYDKVDSTLFDYKINATKKSYTTKGKTEYIKVKTFMYDFSPFDETLFLDVDLVWLFNKKPSELFEECKDVNWTMANTGISEHSTWVDINEVKEKYPDANMWNYSSECTYFKKNESVKAYFDRAKAIFENPPFKGTNFGGARIADELAFQLASVELNEYPHKENWIPFFWFARDKSFAGLEPYKLSKEFYAYSAGGNSLPTIAKKHFSIISEYHSQKSGLGKAYKIRDKRIFILERRKI